MPILNLHMPIIYITPFRKDSFVLLLRCVKRVGVRLKVNRRKECDILSSSNEECHIENT